MYLIGFIYGYIYIYICGGFLRYGISQSYHPFYLRMFHEIIHPAIEVHFKNPPHEIHEAVSGD